MFFKNYPQTLYKFGTETSLTAIQDLSAYVDLIDQVKDNINFYQEYTILDGDRPDTLSSKLYGSIAYYWTFFLLNDSIRQQGWPLTAQEIRAKAAVDYPNTTVTTRDIDTILNHFQVGDTVSGQTSAASGTVLKRDIDLGQLVVSGTNGFTNDEILRDNSDPEFPQTIQLVSAADEHNSIHHYEDADGYADVDPRSAPGALLTAVTYIDRYVSANDTLKEIKVIKPSAIGEIFSAYQEALRTV
tara:strand:- start:49 stop:777 length:729 start_codon:yes stop_codon:yes gene_type:complete